jgi:hypothetical protein
MYLLLAFILATSCADAFERFPQRLLVEDEESLEKMLDLLATLPVTLLATLLLSD